MDGEDWKAAGRNGTSSADEAASAGHVHDYLAGKSFREQYLTPPTFEASSSGSGSSSYGASAGMSPHGYSPGVGDIGAGGWLCIALFISLAAILPFYFFRAETTFVLCGIAVWFFVLKIGDDFGLGTWYQFLSRGAVLGLTGLGIYGAIKGDAVAKHVSDVIVDARYLILIGIGLVTGGYVLFRSAIESEFDAGAVVNMAVSAAVVAVGVYLGDYSPFLSQAEEEISAHATSALSLARHAVEHPRAVVAASPGASSAFVTTKQLNVRDAPNTDGTVVGKLDCGGEVKTSTGVTPGWTAILQPDNSEAYVASRYLSYQQPTLAQCQP
jgi:Bacterial SH3 domain